MCINPFFSIIIPAYQAQKYIINTIKSVLSQDFVRYEIIVVDDGSTDDTSLCVKSLSDERIAFYSIEHSGAQDARYYGVRKAKGKYLIFLDADDCLTPNALRVIHKNIQANPCDLYIGGMILYDIDGTCRYLNKEVPIGYLDKNKLFMLMTDKREIKTLARKVLRKEIALYSGEMIKKHSVSYGEDMFYSMDMLLNVYTIYVSGDVMYEYILRKDGVMNRFDRNKYRDRILMYKAIIYYGNLLDIDSITISRISEVYLVKQLADCLIEIESQKAADLSTKENYDNEIIEIVGELSKHHDAVEKYPDSFRMSQIEILRKYEVL